MVNKTRKLSAFLSLAAPTATMLTGMTMLGPSAAAFVLLSSSKATLPISPALPSINFIWDGKSPEIDEKDKYSSGAYESLEDKEFMQQLLQDALNIWNNVPGSFLRMTIQEGVTDMDPEDKVFSLVVEKSDNLSSAAFAKPTVPDDDPKTIADCDINIADTKTSAKDLAYTITHELGHCVGLGHPHTNYGAIMGYSRMSRQLKLGADDISGAVYLYPDPKYVSGNPKEIVCGRVGTATDGSTSLAFYLIILFPLLLVPFQKRFAKMRAR